MMTLSDLCNYSYAFFCAHDFIVTIGVFCVRVCVYMCLFLRAMHDALRASLGIAISRPSVRNVDVP